MVHKLQQDNVDPGGGVVIVVDGPNLSKDQNYSSKAEAHRFCILLDQICTILNTDNLEIFVSAALKYDIDNIDTLNKLQKDGKVIVTPASRSDDYFAIKRAYEANGWIISNDRYQNWAEDNNELKEWLESRRISFVWLKNEQKFLFGRNFEDLIEKFEK